MVFNAWLAQKLGTNRWCVATRISQRLVDQGYDFAVSPSFFRSLEVEYEREYGVRAQAFARDYETRFGKSLLEALQQLQVQS